VAISLRALNWICGNFDANMDTAGFFGFAGEGLDLTDAGQIIVQEGVQIAQHFLAMAERRANVFGVHLK